VRKWQGGAGEAEAPQLDPLASSQEAPQATNDAGELAHAYLV
jgi:hypothetical protein